MTRTLKLLSISALALSMACDKGNDKPADEAGAEAGAAEAGAEAKVEAKDPATLVEGDKVTVPAVYKELKLGMTGDEAKKIFAEMPDEDSIRTDEYPDIYFVADFDDDTNKISRFYFSLPGDKAKDIVTKAWGEGLKAEELGKELYIWFNPADGLRATLKPGFGEDWDLEFTAYTPYTQFLGAEGAELAFEKPGALLGMSADDIRAKYKDVLVEKSQADAEKDREQLKAMAGDKVDVLGAPKPSMHLEFGPTEYEKYWTRVNLTFNDDNTVRRYWFMVPFELNMPAKDEIMAIFKTKWGEPKEEEYLGDKLFVFGEDPRIEVKENTISKGWDVAIEPKEK